MQASEWQGGIGDAWADEWRRTDRSFAELVPALNESIRAAAPAGPFRALDIGCGAGATSIALAEARSDARITGIDISANLIATARERSRDLENLDFMVGDAAAEVVKRDPADLIFSRHGVMFFPDPPAAFTALHAAAAPGASFVFSCFRDIVCNPWASQLSEAAGGQQTLGTPDVPGPFALSNRDLVEPLLTAAGWQNVDCRPVDYTYIAGEGADPVADAMAFLTRIGPAARLLRDAPEAERPARIAAVEALLAAHRTGNRVDFPAAAWIWSATA